MLIFLHGAGFDNKGAELMLRTAVDELSRRVPGVRFAVDPGCGSYEELARIGLRQLIPSHRAVFDALRTGNPVRRLRVRASRAVLEWAAPRFLAAYGCEVSASVDALIDISGFAFSDQWSPGTGQHVAAWSRELEARGKPVILLPQALGPFTRPETRTSFSEILRNSALVFARDQQSFDYASELAHGTAALRLAPDITLFHPPPSFSTTIPGGTRKVCVVPNVRLLDKGERDWGEKYEACLLHIAQELLRRQIQVNFVVHTTEAGDRDLAKRLVARLNSPESALVTERDPLKLKEFIAGSLFVVGSRYHGLVAAFSSGVPALGMGWSHKYEKLLEDFGCERFVVSHETSNADILHLLGELSDEKANGALRSQITARLKALHEPNLEMWNRVTDVLTTPGVR